MSAKDSDRAELVEHSDAAVEMTYGEGGVPFYIAVLWVIFLVGFMVYILVNALPDFSAWRELFGG
jgi:hypothetical protein